MKPFCLFSLLCHFVQVTLRDVVSAAISRRCRFECQFDAYNSVTAAASVSREGSRQAAVGGGGVCEGEPPTAQVCSPLPNSLPSAQGSLSFWSARACLPAQRGPGVQLFVCDVRARSPTHTCSSAAAGHRFEFHPNKRPAPPTHQPARPPENTMRIRQEGAPRITDVPCALPRSSFTPRGLRYPNTSTSAIALHHPSEAPQSRSAAFSGGHSAFNPPAESPLLCF